jgi:hypothetical protein
VPESAWHAVSFLITLAGAGWWALSVGSHWRQARGSDSLRSSSRRLLRAIGTGALLTSLIVCFAINHASMAPLVWCMQVAAATFLIAMLLAWQPRLLAALAPRTLV